ncbi:MAG: DegV family protein [Lachnospiraceae bacterium]|nr:DegV family protein [Lachnospiraceae bacterium]
MKFRIALDSGGDLPEELKGREDIVSVPLTLTINGINIVDDGHLSQKEIVDLIAKDPDVPKTACPSPQAFYEAFECDAEHIYAVTLSSELSGSYQSALVAKSMYLEDHPDAKVHVFNSVSASCGETVTMMKIMELEEQGLSFEEIIEQTEAYARGKCTLFVLDNLETLRKNGRLNGLKALAAAVLKIKPICYGTPEGSIGQLDQARGMNKAIVKMVDHIVSITPDPENRVLGISYCNCPDRAQIVKDALLSRMNVKAVYVTPTAGLSSVYANDGGIVVSI